MHLKITNLHLSYQDKKILDGIDLEVKRGESLAVMGSSGCGKTSLFKSIVGLIPADSGKIEINAKIMKPRDVFLTHKVGVMFQNGALFDSMCVWENIAFQLRNKIPPAKAQELAIKKLKVAGLKEEDAYLFPENLSGGMRKAVAIARAIFMDPEMIFFDEPTSSLDPITARKVNSAIVNSRQTPTNPTVLIITHDIEGAFATADRIAILWQGRIIACDTPEAVRANPHPFIQEFFASYNKVR